MKNRNICCAIGDLLSEGRRDRLQPNQVDAKAFTSVTQLLM